MANNDDKIATVLAVVKDRIFSLTKEKITTKVELTVEINVSQGTPGDIYLRTQTREKMA